MLAEQGEQAPAAKAPAKAEKPKAAPKKAAPAKAAKPKADAKASKSTSGGMTPKELWRAKLAGKGQLPRGF